MEIKFNENGEMIVNNASMEEIASFMTFVNKQAAINNTNDTKIKEEVKEETVKEKEIIEEIKEEVIEKTEKEKDTENKIYYSNESNKNTSTCYDKKIVEEVSKRLRDGEKMKDLAKEYNIPYRTIYGWYHKLVLKDWDYKGHKIVDKNKNSKHKTYYYNNKKEYILSEAEKEYKDKILICLNYISKTTGFNKNSILSKKYKHLNEVYGIVFEQLAKEVKRDNNIENINSVNTLDLICLSKETGLKQVFFSSMLDDVFNNKPLVSDFNKCAGVISRIANATNDNSVHHTNTYLKVYELMDRLFTIDWDCYYKKHNLNKKVSRGNLVAKDKKLQEYFVMTTNIQGIKDLT